MEYEIKHSGEKAAFDSGAVREVKAGKGRFDLISPFMLERLAKHYEGGAKIYGDRNWEQGIPFHSLLDSALRHVNNYRKGLRNEDHLIAAIWNLTAAVHFEETQREDLVDVPRYQVKS